MQPIIRSIMGDRDIFDRWKKKLRFRAYRDKKYKKKLDTRNKISSNETSQITG
jgi:hypothetical protein